MEGMRIRSSVENPKQLDPLGTAKKFIYNQKFSEAVIPFKSFRSNFSNK